MGIPDREQKRSFNETSEYEVLIYNFFVEKYLITQSQYLDEDFPKVIRGGSWDDTVYYCRAEMRLHS